ncbi:hypothetical protein FB99_41770 (plasmid) [Pantoea agglomerans]|nr:hypothetical protein FB99_41770 [Pantoea agglomerans]
MLHNIFTFPACYYKQYKEKLNPDLMHMVQFNLKNAGS